MFKGNNRHSYIVLTWLLKRSYIWARKIDKRVSKKLACLKLNPTLSLVIISKKRRRIKETGK